LQEGEKMFNYTRTKKWRKNLRRQLIVPGTTSFKQRSQNSSLTSNIVSRVTKRHRPRPTPFLHCLQFVSRSKFIPFWPLIIHVTASLRIHPRGYLTHYGY
jgi:hypothetical protein